MREKRRMGFLNGVKRCGPLIFVDRLPVKFVCVRLGESVRLAAAAGLMLAGGAQGEQEHNQKQKNNGAKHKTISG
jgi:hypothetical protein